MKLKSDKDLIRLRESILSTKQSGKPCVTVCGGTGCRAGGSEKLRLALTDEIAKHGLQDNIDVLMTGCHGFCERGPIVVILPENIFYQQVAVEDVPDIVTATLINKKLVERLIYTDPATRQKIIYNHDVPFYKGQTRIILNENTIIDPADINSYIARGGYSALSKAFSIKPEDVINEVERSGLRGRGGAGFPTAKKWRLTRYAYAARSSEGGKKFVVCNADEGDPGAFMDRSVLESNPHLVLEGMLIAAYAIGAQFGYVYVRSEYPLAVQRLTTAIKQANETGLTGDNILGTAFNFDIKIKEGAGAFVCGEETALIASIEGKRGMPRARPPYPTNSGLWGMPTNINNVETYANVPFIINKGSEWYASIGTEKSKGTKIFSLTGEINNTGLVEVPIGTPIRKVIFDIGGGIPHGKKFKAVQMGGPSGGCVPAEHLDLPIDYESLNSVGAMMGSGGMVVMDDTTCMVDLARFFMTFIQSESCGKCVPCRLGTKRMLEILTRITEGKGEEGDIELLLEIGESVRDTSLCGLGHSSPNPVLTTLRYYKDEYIAHIRDKKCPAHACEALISFSINASLCTGCTLCAKKCPVNAITGEKKQSHKIDRNICIKCGKCFDVCRFDAVVKD